LQSATLTVDNKATVDKFVEDNPELADVVRGVLEQAYGVSGLGSALN